MDRRRFLGIFGGSAAAVAVAGTGALAGKPPATMLKWADANRYVGGLDLDTAYIREKAVKALKKDLIFEDFAGPAKTVKWKLGPLD